MKTMFALAFALVSLNAHAAIPATVLEVSKYPGFERNPQQRDFAVLDNGEMIINVKTMRDSQTYSIAVGQLSENALKELQRQIENIDADAKLVDLQEGKPMCVDAPSYEGAVFLKGQRKVIGRRAGCHEHALENDSTAKKLMDFGLMLIHTQK